MITSSTTRGVTVSAEPRYEPRHSLPHIGKFVFSYHISIYNASDVTVQLLERHWIIKDSMLEIREVKGEGVIGVQPVLQPGESHAYTSWCPLNSELGKMCGTYLMKNLSDDSFFDVEVPDFILFATHRSN